MASSSSLSNREMTASRRVELLAIGGIASYRRLKGKLTFEEFLPPASVSLSAGVVSGAPLEECLLLRAIYEWAHLEGQTIVYRGSS